MGSVPADAQWIIDSNIRDEAGTDHRKQAAPPVLLV